MWGKQMKSESVIVPFGKYKGRPVESLSADRAYCDWLVNQEWFRTQFTSIHTLIINNFSEPDETPEHNVLQAKFLDAAWVQRFIRCYTTNPMTAKYTAFEVEGADVALTLRDEKGWLPCVYVECKPTLGDDYPAVLRKMKARAMSPKGFSSKVVYQALVVGSYTGVGATLDQVQLIFGSIKIILVERIEGLE